MKWRLRCLDAISSTNDAVKEALRAGEPEGLAVAARRQTGGYGRQGRSWSSPVGGMYLSLLLRPAVPAQQLPTLSLVVGLAVRQAIAGLVAPEFAERVQVKWPNDVVFAGDSSQVQKLCGISLEAVGGGVCIGIGVNVFRGFEKGFEPHAEGGEDIPRAQTVLADEAHGGFAGEDPGCCGNCARGISPRPSARESGFEGPGAHGAVLDGKNRLCYMEGLGFTGSSVDGVREAVLSALPPLYDRWLAEGFAPFASEYSAHALLTGKTVVVENLEGGILVEGAVSGIDEQGRLLVVDSAGTEVPISSGEAHIAAIA